MRRSGFFWGIALVVLGALLLLDNFNLLGGFRFDDLFWPLLLILAGVWVVMGAFTRRDTNALTKAEIALEGASRANVKFSHGAGRLFITPADLEGNLLEGEFSTELTVRTERRGEVLVASLSPRSGSVPFDLQSQGIEWHVRLNQAVSYEKLKLETGANTSEIDLRNLSVSKIEMESGASTTTIQLPVQGMTRFAADIGAATLTLVLAPGVAGRIRAGGGLMTLRLDESRFPRQGGEYVSLDFDENPNRVEIDIDAGAGTVKIE